MPARFFVSVSAATVIQQAHAGHRCRLPADGITLEQKQAINKALLKSGAAIGEMNCMRKQPVRDQGRPSGAGETPKPGDPCFTRNSHHVIVTAQHALDGAPGIHSIACDTDGIDGSEDNTGALYSPPGCCWTTMTATDFSLRWTIW